MTAYHRGASGAPVETIQKALADASLYTGLIDGLYGGGTEAGVRQFQAANGLPPTGEVDAATWKALCGGKPPPPALVALSLAERVLSLTGSFETSTMPPGCFAGLTGDFDKQGISFGALQQNFGQGSLQPLLKRMLDQHRPRMEALFGPNLAGFEAMLAADHATQMQWARSVQVQLPNKTWRILEPWRGLFLALGREPDYIDIQVAAAGAVFAKAQALAAEYQLRSERAVALMFDIVTQNGSISAATKALIMKDYAALPSGTSDALEVERMRIVANRRAEAANPAYVEDVRRRKLTIANGSGTVHGQFFDLGHFGITLAAA